MNRQHAVCRMFSPLWLLLISCSLFYLSATTSIIYAEDTCISTKTQKELERFLTETLSSSRSRLAFYIGHGGVDRNLYQYDDSLGKALLSYYTRIEGNPEIIIGLAGIAPEASKLMEKDVPELGVLDDEYCRFLYFYYILIATNDSNI